MLILDRFDGPLAWIEGDDGLFSVARELISPTAKEGDVLRREGDSYLPDEQKTQERRARILEKRRRLGLR